MGCVRKSEEGGGGAKGKGGGGRGVWEGSVTQMGKRIEEEEKLQSNFISEFIIT